MASANWAFRQVFGDRDSQEEPADGPQRARHRRTPLALARACSAAAARARCAARARRRRGALSAVPPSPRAEDLISAVQFDQTGDYLATGDRGGRVVIFESSEVTQRAAAVRACAVHEAGASLRGVRPWCHRALSPCCVLLRPCARARASSPLAAAEG